MYVTVYLLSFVSGAFQPCLHCDYLFALWTMYYHFTGYKHMDISIGQFLSSHTCSMSDMCRCWLFNCTSPSSHVLAVCILGCFYLACIVATKIQKLVMHVDVYIDIYGYVTGKFSKAAAITCIIFLYIVEPDLSSTGLSPSLTS